MEMIDGVVFKELATHADERGYFRELIRVTDDFFGEGFGQLSHAVVYTGVAKAWHIHKIQIDWWYVATGTLRVALHDTRVLYWPPTRDRRRLWIFRYRYDVPPEDHLEATGHGCRDTGVGLVGSITFSLLGETRPDMCPEDIYALHCCWELEHRGDDRCPGDRSVEAGRQLLAQHQPGFSSPPSPASPVRTDS